MKHIKELLKELNIKVYHTTATKRLMNRYNLDIQIDNNGEIYISDKEYIRLLNEYTPYKSKTQIANYNNNKKHNNNNNHIKYNKVYNQELEDTINDTRVGKRNSDLNKKNKLLLEEVELLRKQMKLINECTINKNDNNRIKYNHFNSNNNKFKSERSITPVFIYTDLHYGEIIKRSHVYGYNEYNSDICEQRVIDCTNQFIDYYTNDIKTHKDRIIIAVLSDSINNEHHDSDNDMSIPLQIVNVSKLYAKCFNMIKEAFPDTQIDIIFTSSNHDRIDMNHTKSPLKDTITNSYTYLIINNLINCGFHINWEDEGDWVEDIYGKNVLFTHGHMLKVNTKNHNSIINQYNKINKQFMSLDKEGFSMIVQGHLHADLLTDKYIVCCSPVGADSYARSLGLPFYKPGLTSFAYDSNGEFCNYLVFRSKM